MIPESEYKSDPIQPSAVYSEMYNEMGRFRDYQFRSSTWYTALLLAILGFLIATRFGTTAPKFDQLVGQSCCVKFLIILLAVVIAAVSSYLIHYSNRRYRHLRHWTDEHLEPEWKKKRFTVDERCLKPHWIYHFTAWVLVAIISVVTILPG
jgi:hypothetical protein